MTKFCVLALLLLTGAFGWAQGPAPSLELPGTELYGGFLVTSPDYGNSFNSYLLHGFEGAFSKSITDRLWITVSADYVWGAGRFDVKQFSGTLGPKFYILTGKIRPYATAQAGFARQTSNGFYAGDHHPPLPPGIEDIESGFTYRFGGGAEWQFKPHFYVRLIQWDFQPQPWGRHTPFYQNVGAGIGYRF